MDSFTRDKLSEMWLSHGRSVFCKPCGSGITKLSGETSCKICKSLGDVIDETVVSKIYRS